jgi:SAM-dependent methyltransferase
MKAGSLMRRFVIAAAVAALAAGVAVQAQNPQFKPEVGQAGKDVVWVPTSQVLVNKMLEIAKVTPQDYVIDLGSGDGRTVISAAKLGAKALGIEYNPNMVELSRQNAAQAGVADRATFRNADLFETDFSQATVVTMFLLPDINLRLRPKILDMKPGTRIVSNTFTMEDWQPDETATVTEGCTSWCTALLWIVPAKVEGTWKLAQGQLELNQTFQFFTGKFTSGGTAASISDGALHGDAISFTVGGIQHTGRVNGNTMSGTFKGAGKTGEWSATRTGA